MTESTRPALPPLPEPDDTDDCTYACHSDEQMLAYGRQIVELCAQTIESQTLHRRRIHAACNSEALKPCEMAAALRSLLNGEPK